VYSGGGVPNHFSLVFCKSHGKWGFKPSNPPVASPLIKLGAWNRHAERRTDGHIAASVNPPSHDVTAHSNLAGVPDDRRRVRLRTSTLGWTICRARRCGEETTEFRRQRLQPPNTLTYTSSTRQRCIAYSAPAARTTDSSSLGARRHARSRGVNACSEAAAVASRCRWEHYRLKRSSHSPLFHRGRNNNHAPINV